MALRRRRRLLQWMVILLCLLGVLSLWFDVKTWMMQNKLLNIYAKDRCSSVVDGDKVSHIRFDINRTQIKVTFFRNRTRSYNYKLHKRVKAKPRAKYLKASQYDRRQQQDSRKQKAAAKDMMRTLYRLASSLPNTTDEFYPVVKSLLAKAWRHDVTNATLFRFIFENVTRMNAHDDMMLTRRNHQSGMFEVEVLPKESLLPRPPYPSCSVVGSSGILLGSKCGTLIDENDFVFRFNLASTAGFEDDVGSKINMTTMNPSILKSFNKLHNDSDLEDFSRSKLSDQSGLIWTPLNSIGRTRKAIKLVNDSNLTLVRANMRHFKRNAHLWKEFRLKNYPTTGFYFVSCALALCLDVHLFGFWPFGTSLDGRTIPGHYYNDLRVSERHDAFYELRLILTMHRLGMLKFHIDKCAA